METFRPKGIDRAEVIQVIKTTSTIGVGIKEDPARLIYQYWDFKGNLLSTYDTLKDNEPTSFQ